MLKDGVEELGNYTFAKCENLNTVYAFESLSNFSLDGFEGTSPQLTIWGMRGSAVEYILQETELHFAVREDYRIEQDREGNESEEENEEGVILVECRDCSEKVVLPSVIDEKRIVALSDTLSFSDKYRRDCYSRWSKTN